MSIVFRRLWGRCDGSIINPRPIRLQHRHTRRLQGQSGSRPSEVLSDINFRELYRRVSYTSDACIAVIPGRHFEGYKEAVDILRDTRYNEIIHKAE